MCAFGTTAATVGESRTDRMALSDGTQRRLRRPPSARAPAMICAMRHPSTRLIVALCACLFVAAFAQPAAAKSYSADRFDSVVRVLPDGSLDVTETVVFRFIDGTFKEVFREVPARRTDGVEIVRAEMDGQTMPFGNELGTVSVRQTNGRVRVLWRFRPVEHVTRTFVLNYRVRGVVRQKETRTSSSGARRRTSTPTESSRARRASSCRLRRKRPPGVTTRKTGSHQVSSNGNVVEITTERIAANGWIDAGFRFPARSVASVAPRWQQRAAEIDASAPKWIAAAMLVFAAGLILLVAWRQGYDAPPPEPISTGLDFQQPPDDLSPGRGRSARHERTPGARTCDGGDLRARRARRARDRGRAARDAGHAALRNHAARRRRSSPSARRTAFWTRCSATDPAPARRCR